MDKLLESINGFTILVIIALLGAAVVGWRFYSHRQKRKSRIALLTDGVDVLAQWTYTPAEWRRAVEEEFSWASSNDNGGRVFISPTIVYVQTDHRDHLIDLADQGKVVTHASCRGADESPLKLRVRWKVVTPRRDGLSEEVHYHKEDYRIPVPPGAKDTARRVVEFFTAQLERNPEGYASLVGEDESISLFGNDSF